MHIAYISFEFPPDNALGGIATYVQQSAHLMAARGHDVEVFAASGRRTELEPRNGVRVHWCREPERWRFRETILPIFACRHQAEPFDVVEAPEYNADAACVKQRFPKLPLVVRMHSPSLLLAQIDDVIPLTLFGWLRRIVRAMANRLGRARHHRGPDSEPFCINPWKRNDRVEKMHASTAELLVSPSLDLMRYAHQKWGIPASRMLHVPYPFLPTPEYLSIPLETKTDRIAFLGRLEIRKGILDLAVAIPLILERFPRATFRFIGRDRWLPRFRRSAAEVIRKLLGAAEESVEFTGEVSPDSIPNALADIDICVFPSIWENFPNVCLEAMAAGRGIVASKAGGMAEMLTEDAGLLVPPRNPQAIAEAVTGLLCNPARRIAYGSRARHRLLEKYNSSRIGSLMEEAFRAACCREAVPTNKTDPISALGNTGNCKDSRDNLAAGRLRDGRVCR